MASLNEMVRWAVGTYWTRRDIHTEYALSDGMPDIYNPPHRKNLGIGLINIVCEINDYDDGDRRRVKTYIEKDEQILELATNGSTLPQCLIDKLNARYEAGASEANSPQYYGSKIAGHYLSKVGGSVTIENFVDENKGYSVRTVVRLPLDYAKKSNTLEHAPDF